MDHVRERIVDEFLGPDAVPAFCERRTMRFFEVDGEVAIKSFGQRCRLISSAGEHLFGDHRVKNISNLMAVSSQKLKIEFRVVKDLYDALIGKKLSQASR